MTTMPHRSKNIRFSFTPSHKTLRRILADHNLASLGDVYTNFIYSLYLSAKSGAPSGAKAGSRLLSNALKNAGLREYLPSRVDRHMQADAAEALLVYVWLHGWMTITDQVRTLNGYTNATEAFSALLLEAKKKLER